MAADPTRAAPAVALVGLLSAFQLDDRLFSAVRDGLKDAGYVEGRNVAIKYRSADGRFDRLPAMATDLVSDPVAVIVALAPLAVVAAKAATATDAAFTSAVQQHVKAVVVGADSVFLIRRAIKLSGWRDAMRCRQFIMCGNLLLLAA